MLFLCLGALGILVLYGIVLRWGWKRSREDRVSPSRDDLPPVSVVVAVRNEAASLPALFHALDQQTHPSFEIVIVDDASTDDTATIARSWTNNRPYAHVVSVSDPHFPRKKHALAKGIAAAKHDLLAFTDADCVPRPGWLSVHAATHASSEKHQVLVGYSPVKSTGVLGLFSRYKTLVEGLYMMAAIGWNRPYMAVGRNLSYPRSVFEAVDGFHHEYGGQESMSGDDDLLIQAVRRKNCADVRALLDDRTFVPTTGARSWTEWFQQRTRHVSAGRYYPWAIGVHLTLLHGSLIMIWIGPFLIGKLGLGILAAGLLARHAPLGPAADTFDETDLLAGFPLWELGYALYLLLVVPCGLISPPEEW